MGLSKSKEKYDISTLQAKIERENAFGSLRSSGRSQYLANLDDKNRPKDIDIINSDEKDLSKIIIDTLHMPPRKSSAASQTSKESPKKDVGVNTVNYDGGRRRHSSQSSSISNERSSVDTEPMEPVSEVIQQFEKRISRGESLKAEHNRYLGRYKPENEHHKSSSEVHTYSSDEKQCCSDLENQKDEKSEAVTEFCSNLDEMAKQRTEFIEEIINDGEDLTKPASPQVESLKQEEKVNETHPDVDDVLKPLHLPPPQHEEPTQEEGEDECVKPSKTDEKLNGEGNGLWKPLHLPPPQHEESIKTDAEDETNVDNESVKPSKPEGKLDGEDDNLWKPLHLPPPQHEETTEKDVKDDEKESVKPSNPDEKLDSEDLWKPLHLPPPQHEEPTEKGETLGTLEAKDESSTPSKPEEKLEGNDDDLWKPLHLPPPEHEKSTDKHAKDETLVTSQAESGSVKPSKTEEKLDGEDLWKPLHLPPAQHEVKEKPLDSSPAQEESVKENDDSSKPTPQHEETNGTVNGTVRPTQEEPGENLDDDDILKSAHLPPPKHLKRNSVFSSYPSVETTDSIVCEVQYTTAVHAEISEKYSDPLVDGTYPIRKASLLFSNIQEVIKRTSYTGEEEIEMHSSRYGPISVIGASEKDQSPGSIIDSCFSGIEDMVKQKEEPKPQASDALEEIQNIMNKDFDKIQPVETTKLTEAIEAPSNDKTSIDQKHETQVPLNTIQEIKYDAEKLREDVLEFEGHKQDVKYVYLNEMLLRCLLKLDSINVSGNEELKEQRKLVTEYVQKCIEELDKRSEGDEPDIEVAF